MSTASRIDVAELLTLIHPSPVAYFCAEFGVEANLPIYAGGLGILAGDTLAEASDEGKAYVGVGLFYHHGYLRQDISSDANTFSDEMVDPEKAQLRLVTKQDAPLIVTVPIQARTVKLQCWLKMVGNTPLLLLDSKVDGNEAQDQGITDRLYYGDKEHRLQQEMVLGIGGARLISALGVVPRIWHLNEGHSAMLLFELARERTVSDKSLVLTDALANLHNVVFTNHTLIPAGNDVFSKDLVISYIQSYAVEFPVDPTELVGLGLIEDSSLFSPTMLALRLATVSQAVSKLHAKKALQVWPHHPMVAVTNGVRQAFWQSPEIAAAVSGSDQELWAAHTKRKALLCSYIKQLTGVEWSENDLIIAWARRLAPYKRPLALFGDIDGLREMIKTSPVPVRILMSGKPHANDEEAQATLRSILEFVGEFKPSVVYVQNYALEVAKLLLSGSDVLVNTPVRGFEACGTSGMKAGLNGVLECTTLDGWTDEVEWTNVGWVLDSERAPQAVAAVLKDEIIPLYAKRDASGVPTEWVKRMRGTIGIVTVGYTAKRMLKELEEKVYSGTR